MTYSGAIARTGRAVDARSVRPRDLRRKQRWPAEQGWNPDGAQDSHPPGVWTRLIGARAVTEGLERIGDVQAVMHAAAPEWLIYSDALGDPLWVYHDAGWKRSDGTTPVALTGGYTPDYLTATNTLFNGFPLVNLPMNAPYYYALGANGNLFEPIPGWPGSAPTHDWLAQSVRAFREHLIAINLTESGIKYGDRIRWSDAASAGAMPTSWTPLSTNLAGQRDLTGDKGDLVDGMAVNEDRFALYKNSASYVLDYVGNPYVLRPRRISETSGIIGRNAAAQTPLGNVVVTNNDVVLFDGLRIVSIIEDRLRRWLFRSLDPEALDRIKAFTITPRKEVWLVVPIAGHIANPSAKGAFETLIWHWERNRWTRRDYGFGIRNLDVGAVPAPGARPTTWDADTEAWNDDPTPWNRADVPSATTVVAGDPDASKFAQLDSVEGGDYGDPLAVTSETLMIRESWDCGDPLHVKTVQSVEMLWNRARVLTSSLPVTRLRIGLQDNLQDAINWSRTFTLDHEATGQTRFTFTSDDKLHGRYISIELRITDPTRWVFEGLNLEYRQGARYVPPLGSTG